MTDSNNNEEDVFADWDFEEHDDLALDDESDEFEQQEEFTLDEPSTEEKLEKMGKNVVMKEYMNVVNQKKPNDDENDSFYNNNLTMQMANGLKNKGEKKGFKSIDNTYLYEGDLVQVPSPKKSNRYTIGTIIFVGKCHLGEETFVGIELFESIGKHNGTVDGKKYFECKDNKGLLIPCTRVKRYKPNLENIPEIVDCGFLVKRGSTFKSWKKRWFILSYDFLHYFETPFSKKELGRIHLMGCEVADAEQECGKPNSFKLFGKSRVLIMDAGNQQLKEQWMNAFNKALEIANLRKEGKTKSKKLANEAQQKVNSSVN